MLREWFKPYGTVRSVDLAHDIFTGRCKGFGFVEMEGHEARAAQAASSDSPRRPRPGPLATALNGLLGRWGVGIAWVILPRARAV